MPTFSKMGGGISAIHAGGFVKQGQMAIDPDQWVVTLFRALEHYIKSKVDTDIYDIRFDFPSANDLGQEMPLVKTIIHFEIDDIKPVVLGFGDNVVDAEYDDDSQTVIEYQAKQHIVNFDVGIWASARSGGVTARLKAYQHLNDLFVGPNAFEDIVNTVGVELQSFSGGNFIKEDINQIDIFRVMGMTLEFRVFSRVRKSAQPYMGGFQQVSELVTVDQVLITN